MILPIESPSPYSATPTNPAGFSGPMADAMSAIVSKTGSNTFNPWNIRVWVDPYVALTPTPKGSDRWQFIIEQFFFPAGAQNPIIFRASCQGNASTSVGGFLPSPVPTFPLASVNLISGPLMPFDNIAGGTTPGSGSAIIRPRMMTTAADVLVTAPGTPDFGSPGNYSKKLQQLYAMAQQIGTPGAMLYWTDPRTGANAGTGEWIASVDVWSSTGSALGVLKIGGCSVQMLGGPAPTPAPLSWNYGYYGGTTNGQAQNFILSATQVFNKFAF